MLLAAVVLVLGTLWFGFVGPRAHGVETGDSATPKSVHIGTRWFLLAAGIAVTALSVGTIAVGWSGTLGDQQENAADDAEHAGNEEHPTQRAANKGERTHQETGNQEYDAAAQKQRSRTPELLISFNSHTACVARKVLFGRRSAPIAPMTQWRDTPPGAGVGRFLRSDRALEFCFRLRCSCWRSRRTPSNMNGIE